MAAAQSSPEVPGGKYAALAPDARGHCSWFLTRTNKEHQATMEHPWMKTIYAKTFDRKAYVQYLASQYHVFRELEALCTARRQDWPLPAVYDELLHRTSALEHDLEFWCGSEWEQRVAAPSEKTAEYLRQLHADASDAWLLLCHHFLQYNAVLSGGQYLGSMVSARAQGEPDLRRVAAAASAAAGGAAFYDFAPECQPTHARVQHYIEAVDRLEISTELRERMLVCMRGAYGQLLAMFDETYAVAPTAGISYHASMAQAAGGSGGGASSSGAGAGSTGGSGPKVPPPPLDPADRTFTAEELLVHNGQREGVPILTSVLGRVYDVTVGKDFFGPGGPYEMFAGRDGTYNLAVMSLKKQTLDKFEYELDDEDKECLADWIAYFDNRYQRPIGELRGKRHAVALQDLPRAKKIPFSNMSEDEETDTPQQSAPASKL
mmetsp:Transcript_59807/g.165385  ORF Transcript_59807/g.165385 Transcript_59807/m.165385 type:complete len:433 (+) Transcript_59807:68-1366(+)|eukprot:CAMPEP_0179022002 /NCGR_PEP_ID=MMETSP0796-20121207/6182_1 /TAXON_ID=73915 /ORGANISM="Pyrodinium bahamense, Strain pbaha01" /LENGTH=432 /DNA_ID=CAMNT_0020717853 /DNA_START=60 /DNA_END=1358 /DNA_ORIENTATION=+